MGFLVSMVKFPARIKLIRFLYLLYRDIISIVKNGRPFNEYGLTMYCGRQGSGKTVAMTEYLERMRVKYPECLIYTNYGYVHQTEPMQGWQDIFEKRNGKKGVIFAIDEIQNEYSSEKWRDFPEFLLNEVTQQRKQRIKIVATSQVYTRVVKQLREQCFEVVECTTLAGRWTFVKCFDADDYNTVVDSPTKKQKLFRKWRRNFLQENDFRELFDSYEKVEKFAATKFVPRIERIGVEKG